MPDLPKPDQMPHRIHHVMRRFSLRFVNHQSAVKRRRLRLISQDFLWKRLGFSKKNFSE
jgi:hypothetical protein